MDESSTLAERVQSLPQELIDMIQGYTFSTPPKNNCRLKKQQPLDNGNLSTSLTLLHVSRKTRDQYATSFFPNTTFILHASLWHGVATLCEEWLRTIPRTHQHLVKRVHCIHTVPHPYVNIARSMNYIWRNESARELGDVVEKVRFMYGGDQPSNEDSGTEDSESDSED